MAEPRTELADFHRKVLMEDMMETVGVDILDVVDLDGGQSYLRARANCHSCTCKLTCRMWLAEQADDTPPEFCPNAGLFQMVKSCG